MAGSLNIGGQAVGMLGGSKTIGPLTITGGLSECPIVTPILTTGDNQISVPPLATAFVFQPCAGLATIKFRVVEGDTGSYITPTYPTLISFDPLNLPTSFYLNVGTAVSGTPSEITFI